MGKSKKGIKGSSTPGISKGWNCKKTPAKLRFCKDAPFYKTDPERYAAVSVEINKLNGYNG